VIEIDLVELFLVDIAGELVDGDSALDDGRALAGLGVVGARAVDGSC
jgi:hypothetical protein